MARIYIKLSKSRWLLPFHFAKNTISRLIEYYCITILLCFLFTNIQSNLTKTITLINSLRIPCKKIVSHSKGSIMEGQYCHINFISHVPMFSLCTLIYNGNNLFPCIVTNIKIVVRFDATNNCAKLLEILPNFDKNSSI